VAEGGEDVIHVVLRGLPGDHPHEQLRLLRRRRRRRLLHVPPRPLEPHRDRTGVWDRTEAHLAPSPLPTHHATEIRKVGRVERWGKPGGKEMAPSLGPSVPSQSVGRTYPGGRGGGGDGPDGRVLVRVVVHRGGVWARPGSNSNPTGWVRDRQGNLPGPHSGGGSPAPPGPHPWATRGGVPWRQCELETRQRCFLLTPSRGWGSGSPRRPREPAAAAYFTLTGRFAPGNVCLPP